MLLRHPRRTGRVQREHDHLGTPEHPQTPALAGVLAVRLEHLPAGLVSVPVLARAAARDQRLPQRREQRRQPTHTVGDGALGKIQPMRASDPPAAGTWAGTADTCRSAPSPIPRCPGCPSESAVPVRRRRDQPRCRRALTTAAVAPPLVSPAGRRAPRSPTARCPHCRARHTRRRRPGSGAAPAQRRVLRPAPAGVHAGAGHGLLPRVADRGAAAPPRLPQCRRSWFASRCRAAAPTVPAAAGAVPSASLAPPAVRFSAAALALPPCHAFCGNSAPAGAVLLPRAAARLSGSRMPPCSLPHFARILPHLIS